METIDGVLAYPAAPAFVRAVADEVKAVVGRVHDDGSPGRCLTWAAVGAAALRRNGYYAGLQAGTAYWRRVPADAPASDRDMFGFQYDPDSGPSRAAMEAGLMPEFHAWVGVKPWPGDLGTDDLPAAGVLVDFSAAAVPQFCEAAWGWYFDRPPYPLAMSGEVEGRLMLYQPSREACVALSIMARKRVLREGPAVLGDLYGPAMEVCGGVELKPVTTRGVPYADFSLTVTTGKMAVAMARLMAAGVSPSGSAGAVVMYGKDANAKGARS